MKSQNEKNYPTFSFLQRKWKKSNLILKELCNFDSLDYWSNIFIWSQFVSIVFDGLCNSVYVIGKTDRMKEMKNIENIENNQETKMVKI